MPWCKSGCGWNKRWCSKCVFQLVQKFRLMAFQKLNWKYVAGNQPNDSSPALKLGLFCKARSFCFSELILVCDLWSQQLRQCLAAQQAQTVMSACLSERREQGRERTCSSARKKKPPQNGSLLVKWLFLLKRDSLWVCDGHDHNTQEFTPSSTHQPPSYHSYTHTHRERQTGERWYLFPHFHHPQL